MSIPYIGFLGLMAFAGLLLTTGNALASGNTVDLSDAVILGPGSKAPAAAQTAAKALAEEVEKRTGLVWPIVQKWPQRGPVIALSCGTRNLHGRRPPKKASPPGPEGFSIVTDKEILWIVGADGRGVLYGVGYLLRHLTWGKGRASMDLPFDIDTAPAYAIRGHQLGYRDVANSYDAWDIPQFEQYIRELTFFGVNCIENIPLHPGTTPVMKVSPEAMNRALSEICGRYDLDYWAWIPAVFDLREIDKRTAFLQRHEAFFADSPRLDAVFFPGGDPGSNPPELVLPYMKDLAALLATHHPKAKLWLSLQWFNERQVDDIYEWIEKETPDWLGGLVAGPSSPPIPETRARLPKKYRLRHYPDITHTVRCQYPVLWWDPAFAFTLGREAANPRPCFYGTIHSLMAPYTDGFLTYSDGVHDDVNKVVWSQLGWNPASDVRDTMVQYCRLFFDPSVAERAADGIFALERNWEGPAAANGAIDATLAMWRELEAASPDLRLNWRWQLCLLRAFYDAYTRHRLLYEAGLEQEANRLLLAAEETGAGEAIAAAEAVLARATAARVKPEWRARIVELCALLYDSIGLQTSTTEYHAHNPERGAVLDFLDMPLNNRWWLEDEFAQVLSMHTEAEKISRLREIALWESPAPGSLYDDVGNVAKSPHVVRDAPPNMAMAIEEPAAPGCMWWDEGKPRCRQSWVTYMDWPKAIRYSGLDPETDYVVRTTGYGQCLLRIGGSRAKPVKDGKELGAIKEFPVPREAYEDRCLELTFDRPHEPGVNWRHTSRLTEVWLIPVSK